MRDSTLRLYKYRSLSGEFGRDAIEKAIVQNQLYWQSPEAFNDPFDCLPVLYFGENEKQRRQFFARAATAVYGGPRRERRQRQREMSATPHRQMERTLMEKWPVWLGESSVACFSEVSDHPLMWGHYADSHKGVCLIFDEILNEEIQWFGFPVEYKEARPRVNLTKFNDPEIMMSALFHKSIHWAYEREHRMMQWHQPPGYRDFPPKALAGVVLGAKIGEDDEAFVKNLLLQRPQLEVYQASIDEVEFKLNIALIE
jgi:hypothetical protein